MGRQSAAGTIFLRRYEDGELGCYASNPSCSMEALHLRGLEREQSTRRHGISRVSLSNQTRPAGEQAALQVMAFRSDNPGVCGHGRRG